MTLTWNNVPWQSTYGSWDYSSLDSQSISSETGTADGSGGWNINRWVSFNCTGLVKKWLDGDPNYGMHLASANYGSNNVFGYFASSDNADPSLRPKLEIMVPNPDPNSRADVDDTYTACDPGYEDLNFGDEDSMFLFCRPGIKHVSPIMRFNNLPDVSSVDVVQAKLWLYCYKLSGWDYRHHTLTAILRENTADWDEMTLTWNNVPWQSTYSSTDYTGLDTQYISSEAGTADGSGGWNDIGWVSWNCTGLVKKWLDGEPNYGMHLKTVYVYGDEKMGYFASSENADPSIRPRLEIMKFLTSSLAPPGSTYVMPGGTWNNDSPSQTDYYDFDTYWNLQNGDITITFTCDLSGAATASGVPGYAGVGMWPRTWPGTTQEQVWTNMSAVYGEPNPVANIQINPTNNLFGTTGQELFNYSYSGDYPGVLAGTPLTCTSGWRHPSNSVHEVTMKLRYVDGVNNVAYVWVDGNPQYEMIGSKIGYSFPGPATELYLFKSWNNSGAANKGTVIIGDITITQESSGVPVDVASIVDIKSQSDDTLVRLTVPVIATASSATFSDNSLYVETDATPLINGGPSGIKVLLASGTVALGDRIAFTGTVKTDANDEKYVQIVSIDSQASGTPASPFGMNNKTADGNGLTVSGLLVRTGGKVTAVNSSYAVIDDGSGVEIRVILNGLTSPITKTLTVGNYVTVTGLLGNTKDGATVIRAIRPRGNADIAT